MKGLTESQLENLLVDFEGKDLVSDESSSDEEVDESKTIPVRPVDTQNGEVCF